MTTSDIVKSLIKDSVDIGCSEALHSTALDDPVGVHLSTMTTSSTLPPALPLRTTRVNGRKEGITKKARAPSPEAETSEGKADGADDFSSPPPIPPRLPPRVNHSASQRFPGRPVHDPRPSGIFLLSTSAGRRLSGAELLRSRPPLLPRDAVVTGAPPAGLTLHSVAQVSRCRSNQETVSPSSDSDLVWWPSSGERQLTHYPVSALSGITNAGQSSSSTSRKMNDYIDSPIALHANAPQAVANGLETVENSINSEASDSSFPHHLWPTPSVVASPSSTKIKSSSEGNTSEKTTQCQQKVICARCGKCRCKQCTVARPLPRCWAGECECGARSTVDCCTCMCCVRAMFYHCRTTEDDDFSDDPCACTERSSCCRRWTLLALLSLCLPCLCLYCPLVGAVRLCTACYNRRNSRGCCCCEDERRRTEASKGLLLIESESSSS